MLNGVNPNNNQISYQGWLKDAAKKAGQKFCTTAKECKNELRRRSKEQEELSQALDKFIKNPGKAVPARDF